MTDAKRKILLIEDDPTFVQTVLDVLPEDVYEVTVASDGEEGLKKFDEVKPDLVLLDMLLPKISGAGFLKELRSRRQDRATPVIVISNLSGMEEISGAAALGIQGYLVKSESSLDEIVAAIERVFAEWKK